MIATLLAPPASEADGRRRFRLEIPAGSPLFAGHFPGEPILPGIAHPALVAEALTAAGETLPEIAEIVSLKLRRPVRPGDRLDLLADGPTTDGTVRFEIRLSSQDQEGATVSLGALRTATARSGEGLRPAIAPEAAPGFPPVATLLPHQPPARLVRSIRAVTAESFAGLAEIPAASPFVHQGRAPAYLGLEAAAQGAAVLEALARCASPRPHRPRIGYLVGIRNGRCRGAWLPAGVPFPIAVELTGSAPPLSIYTLRVAAEDGGELVAGTIQTYLAASP